MNSRQKIFSILEDIKKESEINPDPRRVLFKFNTNVFGVGILSDSEEKKILLKLQKEGIVKLHKPTNNILIDRRTIEKFMNDRNFIWVEILEGFNRKYWIYKFCSASFNFWNFSNPFWWIYQLILFLIKIPGTILKHKLISVAISIVVTLLIIDYSMAWKNLEWILKFFRIL